MFFNGQRQTSYFFIYSILCLSKINVHARYFFINEWNTVDHRTPADIMVDVTNNIGLLVLECHNIQNRNNIAFSPYGLTSVLIALYEGVAGEAAIQIHRTARFPYEKDVIRVGFRDIHRLLRSYFLPKEGFLAGLSLNNENITLTPEYKAILQFYGYDLNPNFTTTQTPIILTNTSSTPIVSSTESSTVEMIQTNSMTESSTIVQPIETSESTVAQTDNELEITTSMTNKEQTTNGLPTTSKANITTVAQTDNELEITTYMINKEQTTNGLPTTSKVNITTVAQTDNELEITTSMTNKEQTTNGLPTTSKVNITTESTIINTPSTEIMATETSSLTSQITTNIPDESSQTQAPMTDSSEPQTTISTQMSITSTSEELSTSELSEQSTNKNTSPETLESDGPVDKTESASVETTSDNSSDEIETFSEENQLFTDGSSTMVEATSTVEMNSENITVSSATDSIKASETTTNVDVTKSSEITTNVDATISTETTTNVDVTTSSETTTNTDVTTNSATTINVDQETTSMNSNIITSTTQIDTTTINSESEMTRRKRSLADFIIARYYDGPFVFREPQPPVNTNISLRQKHQYPFLVNGIHEQYNVNYTEYDAVLPFNYLAQIEAVALRLPLDSDKYYLLIVLPLNPQGINNLICDVRKYESIRNIVRGLKETYVRAVIPSFMLKGFVILTNTLQRLGIRNVFEPGHANFSPMTFEHDLYVTNIEQAVTVTIRNYREPTITKKRHYNYPPIEFKVTHPFMYFIIDSTLDVTLMAGKIVNPLNLRIQ